MNHNAAVNDGGLRELARPYGFESARCRWGCQQLIWWATIVDPVTLKVKRHGDGRPKKVPINPGSHPDGTWTAPPDRTGKVRWAPPGEILRAEDRLQGHHTTCPHAHARSRPAPPPRPRQPKAKSKAASPPPPALFDESVGHTTTEGIHGS